MLLPEKLGVSCQETFSLKDSGVHYGREETGGILSGNVLTQIKEQPL